MNIDDIQNDLDNTSGPDIFRILGAIAVLLLVVGSAVTYFFL